MNNLPSVTGVAQPAQRWAEAAREQTPRRIANALAAACIGDTEAYLSLAVDIEERYIHYAAVLQARKDGVAGEEMQVLPGIEDDEAAQEVADAFREHVVETEAFEGLKMDLLDGLAKGYSVVQPRWDTTTSPYWTIAEYEWLDPRYFVFDRETMLELRLRDQSSTDGRKIPTGQFIVHMPKLKTGIPIRGGIARCAAVAYMFVSAVSRQWAAHTEVYGMPLRIGKYDPEVHHEAEIAMLLTALRNLGSDAAAMLPTGMEIEIVDARATAQGTNIFEQKIAYWDGCISKLVLANTLTTDAGAQGSGTRAQGQVHESQQLKILKMDAKQLCATIRREIATRWTLYNFGPDAAVPRLLIDLDEAEDLSALATALKPMLDAGLEIDADEARERFGGWRKPEAGAETVGGRPVEPTNPNGPQTPRGLREVS